MCVSVLGSDWMNARRSGSGWYGMRERKSQTLPEWLPRKDSNLDKVIQSHLCYHYTTRHRGRTANIAASDPNAQRFFHRRTNRANFLQTTR